jgi:hypothetical protein
MQHLKQSLTKNHDEKTFRDRGSGFIVEWERLCKR